MKIRKGFAIGLGISQAIIIVSLLFWLLQHTPTIHAADWNVNSFIDNTDGDCNDGTCSLRDAINLSAANDTVFLPAGNYVLSSTLGQINIAKTITLIGQGATPADTIIDGDNASRIFLLSSGTITMSQLTLQNGQPPAGSGGAIGTIGTIELTLDNAIVQENISTIRGGGISLADGTLNIINGSQILSNTAVVNNNSAGGGVYVNTGTVIISDSIVAGNIAQYGAGISLNQSNAQLTINNGQFLNNSGLAPSPRFPGGAINTGSGSVIMNSGLISGNTAYRGAGAMVDTGSFTLNGGTITDNESNYGGGVYIRESSGLLTINGGSISGNRSIANIFGGGALYVYLGSVVQNGGEINDNTAVFLGGAMEVRFGSFQMNGGIISGNSANNWGGAIYN
ncbi:MAG: CSLREA domain-containing protein, partial [Chloroflexi bacterium]|nr:CSLREA domain-containing protein [Chloroflexota bacterium]